MATFSSPSEHFYENHSGRSPTSFRNPNMNRQGSRHLDPYSNMQGNMYAGDNPMPSMRWDGAPEGFRGQMGNQAASNGHFPYDAGAAQTWNAGSGASLPSYGNGMGNMTQNGNYGPSRSVKPSRGRAGINNLWNDQGAPMQQPYPSQGGGRPSPQGRQDSQDDDDELIPTAIVVKNIPFAVKKEQLVQLMVDMNLPLPYAFNYHFDNGVFRGLAFANFTSPQETEQVIQALNHMDLSGRKLRVEYKKMLPLAERERIEREKRERRGQLEEQHRPLPQPSQLHNQVSMSSLTRNTPSPLSQRSNKPDIDMNDPTTLEYYTQMMVFKLDTAREVLIFPATLEPPHRRVVHTLAHHMGLMHTSRGSGDQRQVHIHRPAPGTTISPTNQSSSGSFQKADGLRHNLGRSSTAELNEGRPYESPQFNTLRGQSSVGLLDVTDSNAFGNVVNNNLRNAKSFADLRSWSPSPVPSSASFPAALQTNGARLQALNDTAGSNTPTLTPAASASGLGMGREEPFLISGFNNLSVGPNPGNQTSPRRQRSFFSATTSSWEDSQSYQANAPIGSKRTVSIGGESTSQDRLPMRQSRGPSSSSASGFRRHNGRGSDELRVATSAIAE